MYLLFKCLLLKVLWWALTKFSKIFISYYTFWQETIFLPVFTYNAWQNLNHLLHFLNTTFYCNSSADERAKQVLRWIEARGDALDRQNWRTCTMLCHARRHEEDGYNELGGFFFSLGVWVLLNTNWQINVGREIGKRRWPIMITCYNAYSTFTSSLIKYKFNHVHANYRFCGRKLMVKMVQRLRPRPNIEIFINLVIYYPKYRDNSTLSILVCKFREKSNQQLWCT